MIFMEKTQPHGPLAEALRRGAAIGGAQAAVQQQPDLADNTSGQAAKPVKAVNDITGTILDQTIIEALKSTDRGARIDALKIAGEKGGASLAGKIALAAIWDTLSTNEEQDEGVLRSARNALSKLLRRTGAGSIPYLKEALIDPAQAPNQRGDINSRHMAHLLIISGAIGEGELEEGIETLRDILTLSRKYDEVQKIAIKALAKVTHVDLSN